MPATSFGRETGVYDVRITAELWETHFFDHVSLLVVDHPADTEMFVDERFQPARPPALAPRAMRVLGPVASARDETGRDVTDVVAARDGRYLSTFAKGQYQGIAHEHFVEFETGQRGSGRSADSRRERMDLSDRQQHQRRRLVRAGS